MTQTANPTPESTPTTAPAFQQVAANEWGQITNLEPNTTYFVVKRPNLPQVGATNGKGKDIVGEVRSFLHEHKVLTQKQLEELKSRYGNPTEKAREVRETVEKKLDEIARDLEARYEKLEQEVEKNLDRVLKPKKGEEKPVEAGAAARAETPGELPTGEHAEPATSDVETATANGDAKPAAGKKKSAAKKAE